MNNDIYEYIYDVCDELDIDVPVIKFESEQFFNNVSETTMALTESDGQILYLRTKDKYDYDYLFFIAHEIRHIWQLRTDKGKYFSGYKPRSEMESIYDYNMQLAEIDAHAFGKILMEDFFGVTPTFTGLDKKIIEAINKRVEIILKEEYEDIE